MYSEGFAVIPANLFKSVKFVQRGSVTTDEIPIVGNT
jgi:hypothetical protein